MKNRRPVNLNLFTIRFPIAAIVSILHRISGLILFLLIPLLLWMLQMSLTNPWTFTSLANIFEHILFKMVLFVLFASLVYHLLAGVRHLLMDMHIGDSKRCGACSARVVLLLSIILTISAGVYLW